MQNDTAAQVLERVEATLRQTRLALQDVGSEDPERRIAGVRNVVVFGRAVTNVLQNLRSRVDGFDDWYEPRQQEMREDLLLRWLYERRSEILKEGRDPPIARSLSIRNLSLPDDLPPAPPNAIGFFMGDQLGGIGWEVRLPDGATEKLYVRLPKEVLKFRWLAAELVAIVSSWHDMCTTEGIEIEAMMPGATTPERDRIRDLEFRMEEMKDRLVDDLQRAGEGVDREFVERFRDTAHKAARQVNESLPLSFPPEAGDEVRRIVIEALTELDEIDESQPLDAVDRLLVRFEQIRHLLRDAIDERVEASDEDGQAIARTLVEWLPGIRQDDIAALAGTSTRTLQRLAKDGGRPPHQMQVVARLLALLRRAWTPEGTVAWFYRPRRELDGQRPVDVLDRAEFEDVLMTMVRQGRAGHGS